MPNIEIYFADVCDLCHKAMDFFRSRDLDFAAYEVIYDEEAGEFVDDENCRAMYQRAGKVDFVPQIFINGNHHVPGWRKLEPMIESGEFDALLDS